MTPSAEHEVCTPDRRRAYLKYRDRQRLQKEEDRRTIEELHLRLETLECERSDLERRVELLQKVRRSGKCSMYHALGRRRVWRSLLQVGVCIQSQRQCSYAVVAFDCRMLQPT